MSFAGIRRWARTGSGAIIPTVEVEVRFRNDDGTAGGLATIYSDNQGNTGITQPGFTAGADGSFELYAASGQYIIVVGSGASQESVPIDIVMRQTKFCNLMGARLLLRGAPLDTSRQMVLSLLMEQFCTLQARRQRRLQT